MEIRRVNSNVHRLVMDLTAEEAAQLLNELFADRRLSYPAGILEQALMDVASSIEVKPPVIAERKPTISALNTDILPQIRNQED